MTNLISKEELEDLVERVSNYNIDGYKLELLDKLINSYHYYKERVSDLELQIEDLLDRDLI